MTGFWHDKIRNDMMRAYSFAPLFEEAGTLLLATKHLWHPWSVKRRQELSQISYELKDRARILRQRGLAWASNKNKFGEDPAYTLSTATYHRYHNNDKKPPCPEASSYTARLAVKILLLLLPTIQKFEKSSSCPERGLGNRICEIIEIIMESPYCAPVPDIPKDLVKMALIHGALLECEGLSYTQATIEDSFERLGPPHKKRKKKSDLSDDKLRKLAEDLDISFEAVKEVFETEFSSWWKQAKEYSAKAFRQKEMIVSYFPFDDQIKNKIITSWDDGMVTQNYNPECRSEKELKSSEKIIKTFISMLMFWVNDDDENQKNLLAIKPA